MNEKIIELEDKLNELKKKIQSLTFPQEDLSAWSTQLFPSITTHDLSYIPYDLSNKLSKIKSYEPNDNDLATIDSVMKVLNKIDENLNLLTTNNPQQASSYISNFLLSMFYITNQVNELFSFEVLINRELLPKNIIRRLDGFNEKLNKIEGDSANINEKIKVINEAYDAAEGLPTTLKELNNTNEEVRKIRGDVSSSFDEIQELGDKSRKAFEWIDNKEKELGEKTEELSQTINNYMESYKKTAQGYIDKCEEAFRTTTSNGLAGAFQEKAEKLNVSIRFWVGGLISALSAGAYVGYLRLNAFESYLSNPNSSGANLAIQLVLSFLSVGAPLWFAWLSTKQIGQRFRLAEDYEFKASVSKAYEGYRREALQLDEDFSQRLFGNALTRLEEPPLRFVEEKTHSSPIMEFLSSDNFKKIIDDGGDKVDAILERVGLVKRKSITNESTIKPEPNIAED